VGFQFFNPFLPLYIRELGVTDPARIALWSGLLAAVTAGHLGDCWPGVRPPGRSLRAEADAHPIAAAVHRDHRDQWAW